MLHIQKVLSQLIEKLDVQVDEFEIPPGPMSKYVRFRYTSTVGNQAFQLIEIELSGYGAIID